MDLGVKLGVEAKLLCIERENLERKGGGEERSWNRGSSVEVM